MSFFLELNDDTAILSQRQLDIGLQARIQIGVINVLPDTVIRMRGHALIEIHLSKSKYHGDRFIGSKPQIPRPVQSRRTKSIDVASRNDRQHIGKQVAGFPLFHDISIT